MATSKISNLNALAPLNSNTANVYFVATDKQSGVSGKVSGTTLANGLYAYNTLNVGNTEVIFPNVVSQFAKNGESYIQVNLLNTADGGSADYVATANTGTDTTYFIDMGYANKDFVPGSEYNSLGNSIHALDGYLYVQGNSSSNVGGNLVIGTTTSNTHLGLIVGGGTTSNVIAQLYQNQIVLNRTVVFGDGTTQNTSADSARTYANGAFIQANAAFLVANTPTHVANSAGLYANAAFIQANAAFLTANTPTHVANSAALYANGSFIQANAAFTKANNALANTTGTLNGSLTVTGTLSTGNVTINNGVVINDGGLFQYTTANSSTVTQLSTKNNPVTCNGRTGQITTNNGALAAGRSDTFRVTNNQVTNANDIIIVGISSGATGNTYQVCTTGVGAGYFDITISNVSSTSQSDTLVINFAIIRVQ